MRKIHHDSLHPGNPVGQIFQKREKTHFLQKSYLIKLRRNERRDFCCLSSHSYRQTNLTGITIITQGSDYEKFGQSKSFPTLITQLFEQCSTEERGGIYVPLPMGDFRFIIVNVPVHPSLLLNNVPVPPSFELKGNK
ncbi:hypothetical protein NPIL_323641 [Nephila pilipes]|uniref:Uncharacterized protein n=1 Tax=Nephila pilipes TaxID=299642 RepID=A0A8X6R0K4_NEPPI|nr:hypothetical protein NPIL_323641 [Nephila pilipes]